MRRSISPLFGYKYIGGRISNMKKQKESVFEAVDCLESHTNSYLTAQEIAYEINTHPSDFTRYFREAKGLTPKKYLDGKLKEQVVIRIKENTTTGKKISSEFGFSSPQSFYRWVKRVCGVSFKELVIQSR